MNPLDCRVINAIAPYKVLYDEQEGTFQFQTDSGVIYCIYIVEDLIIKSSKSYELIISNRNREKSPNDLKLRDTIGAILQEFFDKNNEVLLYICDSGDGKQAMRHRLFQSWFASWSKEWYAIKNISFKDEEGVDNYISIILRIDNPSRDVVMNEFDEAIELLSSKPNYN